MEWIVKIEGEFEKTQRIRITFDPLGEKINFYGEVKTKNNPTEWSVFSWFIHNAIETTLTDIKQKMEDCVVQMRRRYDEYENLKKGFTVLKWIAFEDSTDVDSQPV